MNDKSDSALVKSTNDDESSVPTQTGTGQAEKPSFLSVLNRYKETITLVMFFSGGFAWVGSYFVSKANFDRSRCDTEITIDTLLTIEVSKVWDERSVDLGNMLDHLQESIAAAEEESRQKSEGEKSRRQGTLEDIAELLVASKKRTSEQQDLLDDRLRVLVLKKCDQ